MVFPKQHAMSRTRPNLRLQWNHDNLDGYRIVPPACRDDVGGSNIDPEEADRGGLVLHKVDCADHHDTRSHARELHVWGLG